MARFAEARPQVRQPYVASPPPIAPPRRMIFGDGWVGTCDRAVGGARGKVQAFESCAAAQVRRTEEKTLCASPKT